VLGVPDQTPDTVDLVDAFGGFARVPYRDASWSAPRGHRSCSGARTRAGRGGASRR
jgi:hypothetical protein